ncbi:MAG: FMN-dependent NADH-azoreductase [Burkholderiales bacterium]|nr:FMN-dependent NADH-azoreductase [Phycisphaerae bacterium]
MRLLHVDSSILGSKSASRALTSEIVAAELERSPDVTVTYRDLAANPLQHFTHFHLPPRDASTNDVPPELQSDVADSAAVLEEFLAADVIVIGAPMYNFAIPSQLKAWIDRLAIAGKTFKYGPNGPEGLAGGKRVIIASTRGGVYAPGTATAGLDHQETYLRAIFGFVGITDIQFIRAEGLAVAALREQAMERARSEIAATEMVA